MLKQWIAHRLFSLGDYYSKVPDLLFIVSVYNLLMTTSARFDINGEVWTSRDKNSRTCECCDSGVVMEYTDTASVRYKSIAGEVDAKFYLCNSCGVSYSDEDQVKYNKHQMDKFKKAVDFEKLL
ncbi:hypothetical protein [Alishewanella phage vB_AspM_Slickus01]|nr:hypothetical protein [Alishewanella phage vB_AspM_Slickus01]